MNAAGAVYIVDDDPAIRHALTRLLRAHGFDAFAFSTAHEFLAHPLPVSDACLVLDLQLPDIHGLGLHRQLSAERLLPMIVLTGHGDVATSVQAMKAGAVDFLEKPATEERLLPAVREAMRRHRELRARQNELFLLRARYRRLTPREREVMPGWSREN